MFQQIWFILFGAISFILSQLDESSNIVNLKTLCHRKRWPRSSFLSQERPWPQTFRKISSILAKILYFSTFFDLFFSFREEESLPIAFVFALFSGVKTEKMKVWTRNFLAKSGDVFTKNALNCRRNDERKRIKIFALMKLKRKWQDSRWNRAIQSILSAPKGARKDILRKPKTR